MENIKKFNDNNWASVHRITNDIIYLVEMTNGSDWETNHGYHLVRASSEKEVESIIQKNIGNLYPDREIVSIKSLNDFIGNEKLKTILSSQEE